MILKDFIKLDNGGVVYRLVDANRIGYMLHPYILIEADRNVVIKEYGEYEVVGFEIASKKTLILYIKKSI